MSGRVPPSSRARSRPRPSSRTVRQGADLRERFTGHETETARRVQFNVPKVVIEIGPLDFVGYTTIRDGVVEHYIHKFAKRDKPILAVSANGKQILLIGGRYTFTERGIVDASDKSS